MHHDRPDREGGELELVGEGSMRVPPGGREIVLVAHRGRDGRDGFEPDGGFEPDDDEFQPATPPIYGELARHQREEKWRLPAPL